MTLAINCVPLVNPQWATDHLADPTVRFAEIVWGDSDEWGTAA